MMYEEYKDREGEVVTGIVQQAGDRNNVLIDLGKVERTCRAPSRSTASATAGQPDQGRDHRRPVGHGARR